jgi:adenine deaminase
VASTVSHDSHNLAVIGKTPEDMLLAALALAVSGGGMAAVKETKLLAEIQLPIAGLISPKPVVEIAEEVTRFEQRLPELGLPPFVPFHLLALALPVIPAIRLTDLGMVDTIKQQFVPMEA